MAEYRTVRMSFWNDPYIEGLTPPQKLMYLYLFTSPHTNNLGMLEVSAKRIAFETGLTTEEVEGIIAKFEADEKVFRDGLKLWLTKFIKHQTTTSERLILGLKRLLPEIGSKKICHEICTLYPHIFEPPETVTEDADTVSEGIHRVYTRSGELEEEREVEINTPPTPPQAGGGADEDPSAPTATSEEANAPGKADGRKPKYSASFEAFWQAYPNRVGKGAAAKAWDKIGKQKTATVPQIMNALKAQIEANHFRGKDGQDYIPNPSTWLNQARWEDEVKRNGDPRGSPEPVREGQYLTKDEVAKRVIWPQFDIQQ